VVVDTINFGAFRLSPQLCGRGTLAQLAGFEQADAARLLVIDAESPDLDELSVDSSLVSSFPGVKEVGLYPVVPEKRYIIATEEDLDDEPDPSTLSEADRLSRFHQFRARQQRMQTARERLIHDMYKPLHPSVYAPLSENESDVFSPTFLAMIHAVRSHDGTAPEKLAETLRREHGLTKENDLGPIWSFDVFRPEFCALLTAEILNFEDSGLPVVAPNSMNRYGLILGDVGWQAWLRELRAEYLAPLAPVLFASRDEALDLDGEHVFVVEYRLGEDKSLGFHVDDAEVTFNICLGREFTGGEVYFRGLYDDKKTHDEHKEIGHSVGRALSHLGKHRHGANQISSGERFNLSGWCRSSSFRQKQQEAASACSCGGQHLEHEHEHDNE
jgi:hypothetical protein